jgi:phosphopantothenoylcysteine decarboxylase/phosphopantothenate--cysteine ligase
MKFLITAGPTIEKIDPVRFISNRSSGKMGYALAEAAADAGHEVVLLSGPVKLISPPGVQVVFIESAAEMAVQAKKYFPESDITIMSAAVADYRPARVSLGKIKKSDGLMRIELERTEDILLSLGRMKKKFQYICGFAAETENLEKNAMEKLERKNLDWIAANDVSSKEAGFDSEKNEVILFGRQKEKIIIPIQAKTAVARKIIQVLTDDRRKRLGN